MEDSGRWVVSGVDVVMKVVVVIEVAGVVMEVPRTGSSGWLVVLKLWLW